MSGILTTIKLAKAVAKAIRKDRDHVARINEDYFAGRFKDRVFGHDIPDFDTPYYRITNHELWIINTPKGERPNPDGATLCPDKLFDFDLAPAWIPHDQAYPWIKEQAEDMRWIAAGWTKDEIRAMWDGVLGDIALYRANKLPWYKRAYAKPGARGMYAGTRLFGGIARWVYDRESAQLVAIILGVFACAASGCIFSPPGIFDPSDVDPNYTIEHVATPKFDKFIGVLDKTEKAVK